MAPRGAARCALLVAAAVALLAPLPVRCDTLTDIQNTISTIANGVADAASAVTGTVFNVTNSLGGNTGSADAAVQNGINFVSSAVTNVSNGVISTIRTATQTPTVAFNLSTTGACDRGGMGAAADRAWGRAVPGGNVRDRGQRAS